MIAIPQELQDVMSHLYCERLTTHKENRTLIQQVQNNRNPQLPKILKSAGWKEDNNCTCNYYIVKDTNNDVLFFFAIRCGLVQELYNKERIDACLAIHPLLVEYLSPTTSADRKTELQNILVPIWRKYDLTTDLIISAQDAIQGKQKDLVADTNQNTTRVWNTYSAVELAFFCQNSNCKDKIKSLGFPKHFGTMVFWYYIMPKILETRKYVGCEYVYLFAADRVNGGQLMDYYNTNLHFEQTIFLNGIKPQQDNNCFFMCQKISKLIQYQEDYLTKFSFGNTPDSSM